MKDMLSDQHPSSSFLGWREISSFFIQNFKPQYRICCRAGQFVSCLDIKSKDRWACDEAHMERSTKD